MAKRDVDNHKYIDESGNEDEDDEDFNIARVTLE